MRAHDAAEDEPSQGDLPSHELDSVEAVAAFHRDHDARATAAHRAIDALTGKLGQPTTTIVLAAALALSAAMAARTTQGRAEGPVFGWLEFGATVLALMIALLILVTQRRADELAERRARLTLQLALLSDRRSAKIIALLEELRRDEPSLPDRVDAESDAMATPTNPAAVSEALEAEA
jgi:uncharacterized membrane protein